MPKFLTIFNQIVLSLLIIVFISSIELSEAASVDNLFNTDMIGSANDEAYYQRRINDLNKLRHYLLTSNAEQRNARRDKKNFSKRKLIREYFQSINDPDPNRLEEMKKRFTYCSIQDILHDSLCRRRAIHR